jgi:hypothetical protein
LEHVITITTLLYGGPSVSPAVKPGRPRSIGVDFVPGSVPRHSAAVTSLTARTFAPEIRFVQDLWSVTFAPAITVSEWNVDTLSEALVVAAVGLVILIISLHILNVVARGLGLLTARVLSRPGRSTSE